MRFSVIFLFVAVCCFSFSNASFGEGLKSDRCASKTAVFYNAIPWEPNGGDVKPIFDDLAKSVLGTTWGYTSVQYEENCAFGYSTEKNTFDYLSDLDDMSAGGVATHGNVDGVAVEWYISQAAVISSATSQDLYKSGIGGGRFVNGGMMISVCGADNQPYMYGVGLSNSAVSDTLFECWDFNEEAFFFNAACYGVTNWGYDGGGNGEFCLIGPPGEIGLSTLMTSIGDFLEGVGCLEDGNYATIAANIAHLNDDLYDYSLAWSGSGGLRANVCLGCVDVVGPHGVGERFSYAELCNSTLSWSLRSRPVPLLFEVYGQDGPDSEWRKVASLETTRGERSKDWYRGFELDVPAGLAACQIRFSVNGEEFRSSCVTGASTCVDVASVSSLPALTRDDPSVNELGSIPTKLDAYDEVIIAYQGLAQSPLNVSSLVAHYQQRGLTVRELTDDSYRLVFDYVKSYYQYRYAQNSSPPLLVLCGPVTREGPLGFDLGIESVLYEADLGTAGRCGEYVRSDWPYTDVDLDGIPDGPITRLPVLSQSQLDDWVQKASSYCSGTVGPTSKNVGFICGDLEDEAMYSQTADIHQRYREMGYSARTILRASDYPVAPYGWSRFQEMVNAGLSELWIVGSNTFSSTWTDALPGYDVSKLVACDRSQGVIVWGANCHIAYNEELQSIAGEGEARKSLSSESVLLDLFNNEGTFAVGGVGHYCGGWDFHHELMRSYLMEFRESAVVNQSTISQIVWNAVCSFISEYPELRTHALGIQTIGCDVTLQVPTPAGVQLGPIGGTIVKLRNNATSRPRIEIEGSTVESVAASVYDLRGRRLRDFGHVQLEDGRGTIEWGGRSNKSEAVASGLYFFKVSIGGRDYVRKVLLLK